MTYAREDEARAADVAKALQAAGRPVSPAPDGAGASATSGAHLVLWSRHALRRRLGRRLPGAVFARLDDTPPPQGARAFKAADLRAWRGRADQPAWRALIRKLDEAHAAPPADATGEPVYQPTAELVEGKGPMTSYIIAAVLLIGSFALAFAM